MISFRSCLWFDGQALPAAEFYKKVFKNVEIEQLTSYAKAGQDIHQQEEGTLMTVAFSIGKQKFLGLNGGPVFKFTPSFSNFVFCSSVAEAERIWSELSVNGKVRMELAEYPWSKKYGWTTDRFGVEWQIMYSEGRDEVLPAFLFVDRLFGQGQRAIDFYVKHFTQSSVDHISTNDKNNSILFSQFTLGEQKFVLMEGEGAHGHSFNEAYSIIIECDTQDEIDLHWEGLSKGGMQSDCGWLKDSFGISWQIVPKQMSQWLKSATSLQFESFMFSMLQMKKLDIAKLRQSLQ